MTKTHTDRFCGATRRGILLAVPSLLAASALPARAQTASPIDITLSLGSKSSAYGGVLMADKLGLFERHGLRVKMVISESGNASMTALVAGSVQFAGAGPDEGLTAHGRHQDVVFVSNLYRGLSGSLVLATSVAKGLGVAPNAPINDRLKALNNLIIASPSANSAYLVPIKTAAGALGGNARYTYMTQGAMVASLRTGAIQGMLAASPFTDMSVARGEGVVWISGPAGELPPAVEPISSACIQTTMRFVTANPDTVRRVRAVVAEAAEIIKTQPAKAREALGRAYPDLAPDLVDRMLSVNGANWTHPVFTPDDIKREIAIVTATGNAPGLDGVDPASLLAPS
jgi:ABC-type nitrate/sulfonate/bicarbonate transport system substrate-binding protein